MANIVKFKGKLTRCSRLYRLTSFLRVANKVCLEILKLIFRTSSIESYRCTCESEDIIKIGFKHKLVIIMGNIHLASLVIGIGSTPQYFF